MSCTPGFAATADREAGGASDRVLPDVEPVVQIVDDVHQADRVDVEDRGCVRIVAQLRRIAGEAENVLQPDRRCAQQIALNAQHIAVAAGVVQDRLDADVLLDLHAEALRAHAGAGARRIRHVDRVDSQPVQHAPRRRSPCCSRSPWAAQSPPS